MSEFPMWSRRAFLQRGAELGLGSIALDRILAAEEAPIPGGEPGGVLPHFRPRAKRVIFLTQSGGPSQLELFDHKPELHKLAGTPLPESVRGGQKLTGMTAGKPQLVMPGLTKFDLGGKVGNRVSEWLPHLAGISDQLCIVNSMVTDQINHAPAMTKLLTGHHLTGRPSIGSWFSYGLGSLNRDLPHFVVLVSRMLRGSDQPLYDHYWGSGFLPSVYQGVKFRNAKEPVLFLDNPAGMSREVRRAMLDGMGELNRLRLAATGDDEIATRIEQYEMAFRMQASVPALTDLGDEPEETFELYGADSRRPGSYAANCILARRLAERGVRFVQLFHPDWDSHSRLRAWCSARCRDTDQASAALVIDLKRRGLLDDTLVVWGGEFGRSVAGQGNWKSPQAGRDHHPRCFTMWLAGGGVQPGLSYGKTDDFSYNVAENPVQVRDLHATILHLMGIQHERFTHRSQGLDFRLTGVEPARVVHELLA